MKEIIVNVDNYNENSIKTIEGNNLSEVYKIYICKNKRRIDLTNKIAIMAYVNEYGNKKSDILALNITNASQGEIELPITNVISSENGVYACQIAIYGENNSLEQTAPFSLVVENNIFSKISNSAINSSDFHILSEAIKTANEYSEKLKQGTENIELQYVNKLNKLSNKGNDIFDISVDVNSLIQSKELNPLEVPTYVEKNNQIVHPSVLYFEKKWNGYNFWMMATPYTDTNSKWENPCVYCSEDGVNWIVPDGVNNPIVPKPEGAGYNADVNLCMDKFGETMYCTYRVRGEAGIPPHVDLIMSDDGVNWSAPKKIMQMPQGEDCAVPNVWYEDGKYYMSNIDLDQKDPLKRSILKIYTCNTIDGDWEKSHETQIPNIPTNLELWHYEIRKIGSKYIIMYTVANKGGYGAGGRIYMASSYNLKDWETSEKFLITPTAEDKSSYKSSFIPYLTSEGLKIKVWYSETTWLLYYTELKFNNNIKTIDEDLKFIENNYNTTIFDDFIDDNNTIITNRGVKTTNKDINLNWSKILGSDFSIINNKCKLTSDVNSISCVRLEKYEKYEISTVVNMSYNKPMFIVLRCLNSKDFIRVGLYGNVGVRSQKINNGLITKTYFDKKINSYSDKNAIKLTVKIIKDKFIVYVDNTIVGEFIEEDYSNNPFYGIQTDNQSVTFDYFIIYTDGFLINHVSDHNEKCINTINGCINKKGYCDTFNRDNNELLLGGKFICTPDGSFGIIDKQAYSSKAGNNFAIYDTKTTEYTIETIININGGFSIPIRYIDNKNFIRINYNNSTQLVIQKVENGLVTDLSSKLVSNFINKENDKLLKIHVNNENIIVYENGIELVKIVNNFNSTATKVGIQNSKLENRIKTYLLINKQ